MSLGGQRISALRGLSHFHYLETLYTVVLEKATNQHDLVVGFG